MNHRDYSNPGSLIATHHPHRASRIAHRSSSTHSISLDTSKSLVTITLFFRIKNRTKTEGSDILRIKLCKGVLSATVKEKRLSILILRKIA
jgi:hypothetical protein